ncbi:high affinity immunoglobulin epsilon receptor subunit alpha [Sigmodon hispidus]
MATTTGGSTQLWLTLLFISLGIMLTAAQKSIVSLNPPWIRIFTGDNVTLTCHGNNSLQGSATKWFHNDTISKVTTSQLNIVRATFQDSGKYMCQKQGFYKSKPVHLEVMNDWLLLQTSADTVLENESFDIRCHGWRNWNLHKVIYYKDALAFKYCYENTKVSIINANSNDSGIYHCTGDLRRVNCTSEKFRITVIKGKLVKNKIVHRRGRESGHMFQCFKSVQQGHLRLSGMDRLGTSRPRAYLCSRVLIC